MCQEKVCECDPYCCLLLWDSSCAETNYFFPGCTAKELCCEESAEEPTEKPTDAPTEPAAEPTDSAVVVVKKTTVIKTVNITVITPTDENLEDTATHYPKIVHPTAEPIGEDDSNSTESANTTYSFLYF